MTSFCRDCNMEISFRVVQTFPKRKVVPINAHNGRLHRDSCLKKNGSDRNKAVKCLEKHQWDYTSIALNFGDWKRHSEIYGCINYESWNPSWVEVNV